MVTPADRHVARRIRGKRLALGLSEASLAQSIGVSVSRLEAYERAMERVPQEHLLRLSEIMGVPLSYFLPAGS